MTYIDLMNAFWLADEQKEFTPVETRLYFFLLHLSNRFFWKSEWLEYGDEKMQATVGISVASLRTARNRLKDARFIDFVAGGKGHRVKTRYQILTPKLDPIQDPMLNPTLNPIPYYNKIKTKNNGTSKISKREYVASGSDFD